MDSTERAYLHNFHKMLRDATRGDVVAQTEVDKSHFERLENLILIHIDIKGKNYIIYGSKIDKDRNSGSLYGIGLNIINLHRTSLI